MWGQILEDAEHDLLGAKRTPDHNLGEQLYHQNARTFLLLASRLDCLTPEVRSEFPAAFAEFFATAPGWLQLYISDRELHFLADSLTPECMEALRAHRIGGHRLSEPLSA